MTTHFISRHPGAVVWAHQHRLTIDIFAEHLAADFVRPGDTVIGILPVHLVAEICSRGARYFNLSLDMPPALRGKELSAEQLDACGARLESFNVTATFESL